MEPLGQGNVMTNSSSDVAAAKPADPHFTDLDVEHGHRHQGSLLCLMLGAVGIVYGDIGTSPIYAFRETFAGHHRIHPDELHIYGVLSLVFWSMIIVVLVKYVLIIMRADNKGEGGSLALLALINRSIGTGKRWTAPIVLLGVFATALFYGDSMITPAMSVLSATEGLQYVAPALDRWIVPIAVGILVFLFMIQSRGTAKVGLLFGPIMLAYFLTLAALGIYHIIDYPEIVLAMINPLNALQFFLTDQLRAFVAMGAVEGSRMAMDQLDAVLVSLREYAQGNGTRTEILDDQHVRITRLIDGPQELEHIILVGGGAYLYTKAVRRRFPKHNITEVADPMYANVRGFQLLGEQYVRERPELFRADGSNVTSEASEPAESQ